MAENSGKGTKMVLLWNHASIDWDVQSTPETIERQVESPQRGEGVAIEEIGVFSNDVGGSGGEEAGGVKRFRDFQGSPTLRKG
ncbi:hypothetical protein U1Q18_017305 [Sarracenia purpurea var. burkii]